MAAIHAIRDQYEESLERHPSFARLRARSEFRAIVERMERDVADRRARAVARGLYDFASLTRGQKLAGR